MPFKSKSQQRFMFSQHPEMAKEWADKTPDISKLPEHVKKMADGGDTTAGSPADIDSQGLQTPPEVLAALAAMTGEAPEGMMEPLSNEAGEISLGGNAPEMEGMANKIQAYSKGVMGKGTPNEMTIWGVKGDPEEIAKLGFGEDPASIPEHILKQHGILPSESISIPGQNAPNAYAKGGEVKTVHDMKDIGKLAGLKSMMEAHGSTDSAGAMGYDDGGDVVDPTDVTSMLTAAAPAAAAPVDSENGAQVPQDPEVDQNFINKLNAGTAMTPPPAPSPLSQAAGAAQSLPPTNPSIYQGITADQRASLMNQLLAQKASPGGLAASGVAGLGDAISNAFGKGGQNAQGAVRQAQAQNVEQRIGTVDTQRAQRMQDLQANLAQQENDPSSAYSNGMRQFYSQLTGKTFPSGISASMMKSAFPDYAKIFDSQLQAATQQGAQKVEAGKAVAGQSVWQRLLNSITGNPAEESLTNTATGGQSTPSGNSNGWSVVK
jgi:hypothetical protein